MFTFLKKFSVISFIAFIISCGNENADISKYGEVFEAVIKSDSGIFRSLQFGMSPQTVMEKEGVLAEEADEGYLYYDIILDKDTNNSYTLAYTFNSLGLSSIEADIYPQSETSTDELMNAFKEYFTKKYGNATSDKGFFTWQKKTGNKTTAISLSNESVNTDSPVLSLSIYIID